MCPFPKGTFIVSFHYINSNILISSNYVKKKSCYLRTLHFFLFLKKKRLSQDNVKHVPTPQTSHVQNEASTHFISKP